MSFAKMVNESNILDVAEDKNPFFYIFVAKMMKDKKKDEEIKLSSKLKSVLSEVKKFCRKLDNEDLKIIATSNPPSMVMAKLKDVKLTKEKMIEFINEWKQVIENRKNKFSDVVELDDLFDTFVKSEPFEEFFK